MGFMVIGNSIPYFYTMEDLQDHNIKEVDEMSFINLEIRKLILDDLLEAIENDLEEKNNCNPKKWIKKMFRDGLL